MTIQSLKIATWNLDHPKPNGWKKKYSMEAQIQNIDADIWILTETNNTAINLISTHHKFTSTETSNHDAYTTVWVKSSLLVHQLRTFDSDISVCVSLKLSNYNLLVYGTLITWHGDRGQDGQSKNWEEHYQSIQLHGDDWHRLLQENPNSKLIIAGDFNQVRDGSRWYGTDEGINRLTEQLKRNNLICLTCNAKPAHRHSIDHICLSANWIKTFQADSWEGIIEDGIRLSDHNGVYAEVIF